MSQMVVRIISSICLSVFLLISCAKEPGEAIIGRWEGKSGDSSYIEFFNDQSVLLTDGTRQLNGTWTKVGDHRIKSTFVELDGATATLVFEDIQISGDKLSAAINGESGEWIRAD